MLYFCACSGSWVAGALPEDGGPCYVDFRVSASGHVDGVPNGGTARDGFYRRAQAERRREALGSRSHAGSPGAN